MESAHDVKIKDLERRCDKKEAIILGQGLDIAKLSVELGNLKAWILAQEDISAGRGADIARIQVQVTDLLVNKDKVDARIEGNHRYLLDKIGVLDAFRNKQAGYMGMLVVSMTLLIEGLKSKVLGS